MEVRLETTFASLSGDLEAARRHVARGLSIATALNHAAALSAGIAGSAEVERRAGNVQALVKHAGDYYTSMVDAGDVAAASTAAAHLAEGYLGLDHPHEAKRFATLAVETSAAYDFASQAGGRGVLAVIAAQAGDAEAARAYIDEAIARCEGIQWPEEVGNTHLARAEVMRLLGHEGEATASAERAFELYAAKGIRSLAEKAAAMLRSLRSDV